MSPRKLLFIDDEPDLAMLMEQQFENKILEYDVELIFAENGLEGLSKLNEHKDIEVILTDINMPVMDGLEFVAKAKLLDRLLKIVIVSAYHDMSNIRKAMNRGAYDFITKPIDLEDLTETIARAIKTVDQVKADEAELKRLKEIEKEMEMIKKIQSSLLPSTLTPFFQNPDFEVFGTMISARMVGGCFYDFFPASPQMLAVVIGETTSKGLSAATYIFSAREAIRRFTNQNLDVNTCVKQINDFLFYQNRDDIEGISLFFGIFNIANGELEYSSVGIPPALLVSSSGEITVQSTDAMDSIGKELEFHQNIKKIKLQKDEIFFIYSHELIKVNDGELNKYTEKRLQGMISANHKQPLGLLVDSLVSDIRTFTEPFEQASDYVFLSLKFKGN